MRRGRGMGKRPRSACPRPACTRPCSSNRAPLRTPSCVQAPTSEARLVRRGLPSGAKYGESLGSNRIETAPPYPGRWLSGRKHPPAKRVGGVKLPRGFESLPSRSCPLSGHSSRLWQDIVRWPTSAERLVVASGVESQRTDQLAVVGEDADVGPGDEELNSAVLVGGSDSSSSRTLHRRAWPVKTAALSLRSEA